MNRYGNFNNRKPINNANVNNFNHEKLTSKIEELTTELSKAHEKNFNAEKLIAPFGILPSFCSASSFPLRIFLCLSHVTPTMYSSLSDTIEIINSGGLTQFLPFSLIEQRSGSNKISS